MRCKNCGAHYRTMQLSCPYCDTENILGRIWQKQRTDAELEYEKTSAKIGRITNPFVLNRVLSRIIVIELLIGILSCIGMLGYLFIKDYTAKHPSAARKAEQERIITSLYESGEHLHLYNYLSEQDISNKDENFIYWQAGIMAFDYNEFRKDEIAFFQMDYEQRKEDTYFLKYSVDHGIDILTKEYGIYSELAPENIRFHEDQCSHVRSYLQGFLGITEEEIDTLIAKEYIYSTDIDELVEKVRTRNGW